jgi:hypothetical protein
VVIAHVWSCPAEIWTALPLSSALALETGEITVARAAKIVANIKGIFFMNVPNQ